MSTVRLSANRAARGQLASSASAPSSVASKATSGERTSSKQPNDAGPETAARKGPKDAASPLPDYVREVRPAASCRAYLCRQQLGEIVGRGAFGSVYRALNWTTGETVAVKQVALGSIPASELPEIMVSFLSSSCH